MQLDEIFSEIEKVAPPSTAAHWDKSGLQVASDRKTADALAVCLDPTPTSIRAALNHNAHCIVCHHPLSLSPDLPCCLDAYHEALRLLLTANVALYAAHTPLDANPAGPAGWLAEELNLTNRAVLDPLADTVADFPEALPSGFGLAGDLPASLEGSAFVRLLSRHIDLSTATISGCLPRFVTRVAYCTGSGASLLPQAGKENAEIFITGDVKYHTALSTEICLLDVGHHSLEEEMMRRMSQLLAERLSPLTVCFVPSESPLRLAVSP
ncbi:MAG: Nif3-like dinuclear metal center hexameric protein [Desulfovibrio sp.]|jgi:dinuclear metal center YbgI/SA1388 family protein|nr:Nif3-like dinuclear metal center hexameric protein [Desulfovibrio sp.]